ncbi:MAG: hypothetical protein ACI4RD_00555 [Kiritimatiellia bacterium]
MTRRTRRFLVPSALAATGLVLLFLSGCRKEQEAAKPALPPNSPAVYMHDPEFRRQLSEQRQALQAIVAERQPLVDRMQELVKSNREDLAVLQQIPEWNELHQRVVALNERYEALKREQLTVVRDRLAPKQISK